MDNTVTFNTGSGLTNLSDYNVTSNIANLTSDSFTTAGTTYQYQYTIKEEQKQMSRRIVQYGGEAFEVRKQNSEMFHVTRISTESGNTVTWNESVGCYVTTISGCSVKLKKSMKKSIKALCQRLFDADARMEVVDDFFSDTSVKEL